MIVGLCREIKQKLKANLNWMERAHGLVFPNKVEVPGQGKPKVLNLPFEWGVLDCSESSCVIMDERLKAVTWFESNGSITPSGTKTEAGNVLEADIRMVSWVNLQRINPDSLTYDKCINTLERELAKLKLTSDSYSIQNIEIKKTITDGKSVIGKYDYRDKIKLQLFPYFIFAVDFKVSFFYSDCSDIEIEENCGEPLPSPDVFEPIYLVNSNDQVLRTITQYPTSGKILIDDIEAKNSEESIIGSGPFGSPAPVPDIDVYEVDGIKHTFPAGKEVTCSFRELELTDSAGALLLPVISYPEDGKILAPDGIVNLNGVPHTTVKSGGSVNIIAGPVNSGIRYQDVHQQMPSGTSYQLYDYGWHIANNSYNRSQTSNPSVFAELELNIANANLGYKLLNNNLHGHKWRFTGVGGGYFDNIANSWFTLAGASSNYATEVSNGVVYDHLTGRKYYINNSAIASWATAMINPASTIAGETGWIACSINDILSIVIGNEDSNINRAMPVSIPFTSNTNTSNTSQAYYLNKSTLPVTFTSVAKTNNTLKRLYFKHL